MQKLLRAIALDGSSEMVVAFSFEAPTHYEHFVNVHEQSLSFYFSKKLRYYAPVMAKKKKNIYCQEVFVRYFFPCLTIDIQKQVLLKYNPQAKKTEL